MLNVDIIGQLVPNPLTMIVQLCSTLVLFLLAKIFLWPSVKKFLDARTEKMQSDMNAAEQAKQDAIAEYKKATDQLVSATGKAEDIINAAVKQAKDEKASILAQADREANAARKRAHEQIEAERTEMIQSMQKEMVEVALSAAGKLLGEKNPEELDRQAIDMFVKEAGAHGE
ncbi:MAG: F0F1 ATP synthase subunit B [Solobacterium sp.]|nr:F0F1 ATP synthase subunit B [Solobacterium sp.]